MSTNQALYTAKTNDCLIKHLKRADNFWTRFCGLMLTKALDKSEALLISSCNQVHTHFMRYSIDIIFLDKQLAVIAVLREVKPWRFTKYYKKAQYVLETMPQAIPVISQGEQLVIK
jgi:uncharacterized protein